ncbi:unnamed protein product [Adineta ricciae]|uniref:Uncharacterized protein n=1 Tax=Adineta ricciae TaxID=249248 RepID=A0A813ML55_ADIRI|nr:unnamed protein product [Adineta ricciae]CAF1650949.1 unnamed protein product [Adineta ricciae]
MANKTSVYNGTTETIKVLLLDTNNRQSDQVIAAGQIWTKETESGSNTLNILPLTSDQNFFTFTLESRFGFIIQRKLGKLVILPAGNSSTELWRNRYYISKQEAIWNSWYTIHMDALSANLDSTVLDGITRGRMVFNESHETVKICVTDENERNSHAILKHGEHIIIKTANEYLSNCMKGRSICVSVLDFNSDTPEQACFSLAKCSTTSWGIQNMPRRIPFVRINKIDAHFTLEEDEITVPFKCSIENINKDTMMQYLLGKGCSEIRKNFRWCFEVKQLGDNQYTALDGGCPVM